MTTVEFSWLVGCVNAYGGDHRTQHQIATLTSMVSGFLCKKPVSVESLMPDYPWPDRRKQKRMDRRALTRALATSGAG